MRALIKRLPPSVEFICVVVICFGYFIYRSFWWVDSHTSDPVTFAFTDRDGFNLIASEVMALGVVGFLLAERGWKLSDASLDVSWRYTFGGIFLLGVYYGLYFLSYALVSDTIGSDLFGQVQFSSELSLGLLIAICIVNPVFEELIVVVYVIQALEKKHGIIFAVGASALIRLLYHLYQGPIAAVAILPLGVLFAVVYWRWRSVWPLIVAHGLADLISLWPSK